MVAGRDWGREGNMGNRKKEKEKELKGGLGYGERIGVGMEQGRELESEFVGACITARLGLGLPYKHAHNT